MMTCDDLIQCLETLSPRAYACDWDNPGLLVGRRDKTVRRVMIALDASRPVVERAVAERVDLLVTHHPMMFRPIAQLNEDDFVAEKALTLAENGIGCYAMHTNFDTVGGMAQLACGAEYLDLTQTSPICVEHGQTEGLGRYGTLPEPMTAREVAELVKKRFAIPFVMLYQDTRLERKRYERIAVLPGSGKSEMRKVKNDGYELYLTGDFTHHEGLDAMDMGLTVIDATHAGLEHIFIRYIAEYLRKAFGEDAPDIIECDMGLPMRLI